ncbi:hypothetical protein [Flavobacterium cerinum]|uniref:Uncharacterized protein n=1 Tax=Flavobacterium cerinum TaxID=2502784 RepID=A0A3S3TYF3_9FLAO|nr:hypothetical protein [Flavobacterium cerinum]RWW96717.1 hypothetical protein EPI11_14075 [Flavobacterium cerinum]
MTSNLVIEVIDKFNTLAEIKKRMVKRIVIVSIIYVLFIVAISLNADKIGDYFVLLITISGLIFSFFLIGEIYRKYIIGFKPKNNKITYSNSENTNFQLKKISTRPFLFGLEKGLISDDEFYFDDENFYAVNKEFQKAIFKLSDITEISKTSIQINNGRLWQVKIKQGTADEITFKFAHNYTIWNKNFYHFYEKIKLINPKPECDPIVLGQSGRKLGCRLSP